MSSQMVATIALVRDNGGRTALKVAREEKKDVIVNYLVARGGIE